MLGTYLHIGIPKWVGVGFGFVSGVGVCLLLCSSKVARVSTSRSALCALNGASMLMLSPLVRWQRDVVDGLERARLRFRELPRIPLDRADRLRVAVRHCERHLQDHAERVPHVDDAELVERRCQRAQSRRQGTRAQCARAGFSFSDFTSPAKTSGSEARCAVFAASSSGVGIARGNRKSSSTTSSRGCVSDWIRAGSDVTSVPQR